MVERYYPFDAGTGNAVRELEWNTMAKYWVADGTAPTIVGSASNLAYLAPSGSNSVIGAGEAFVRGFKYINDASVSLTHDALATGGVKRSDLICLILDRAANTISLGIVKGTDEVNGADPTLTQSDTTGVWQMPLWRVPITASGGLTQVKGVDLRTMADGNTYSCVSTYRPPAAAGRVIFCRDTQRQHYSDSSGRWKPMGQEIRNTTEATRDFYGASPTTINPGVDQPVWSQVITLTEWVQLEIEAGYLLSYNSNAPRAGYMTISLDSIVTDDTTNSNRWHNLAHTGDVYMTQTSKIMAGPGTHTIRGRVQCDALSSAAVAVFAYNYKIREIG